MKEEIKYLIGTAIFVAILISVMVYFNDSSSKPVSADILMKPDSQAIQVADSKVTLVEFGDYECPACGALQPLVAKTLQDYKGKINFVFRNFPLPQHTHAQIAAEAAESAGDQGKFWEMHDLLYARQEQWTASSSPREAFIGYAKELGMNTTEFAAALDANKYAGKIQRDIADGNSAGVNATPTFFVNGKSLLLSSETDLSDALDAALKQ